VSVFTLVRHKAYFFEQFWVEFARSDLSGVRGRGEFALTAENLRLWGNLTSSLNGDFSDHAL